jgi:glycosyltransferase involved in cell wall biosynthesis
MSKDPRVVFIVWAPYSPRSKNLSERLGAHLYLISYKFKRKIYSIIKYPLLCAKTLYILKREKPEIILCQSPPIFCALAAMVYQYLTGRKNSAILIDAHTQSFDKPWSYFKALNRLALRRASMVIITNQELQSKVLLNYGISPIVLEDRIPDFDMSSSSAEYQNVKKTNTKEEEDDDDDDDNNLYFKVAVISSFAADEPLENVLDSAEDLSDVKFFITGDKSKADKQLLKRKLNNVVFTGFLDHDVYISLLRDVDTIMVLTKRDRTMLAGAYEALALEKPLITSNRIPLKRYFNKGAIHVDNSAEEIKQAIKTVQRKKEELDKDIHQLKIEKINEWEDKFKDFKKHLTLTNMASKN